MFGNGWEKSLWVGLLESKALMPAAKGEYQKASEQVTQPTSEKCRQNGAAGQNLSGYSRRSVGKTES